MCVISCFCCSAAASSVCALVEVSLWRTHEDTRASLSGRQLGPEEARLPHPPLSAKLLNHSSKYDEVDTLKHTASHTNGFWTMFPLYLIEFRCDQCTAFLWPCFITILPNLLAWFIFITANDHTMWIFLNFTRH